MNIFNVVSFVQNKVAICKIFPKQKLVAPKFWHQHNIKIFSYNILYNINDTVKPLMIKCMNKPLL